MDIVAPGRISIEDSEDRPVVLHSRFCRSTIGAAVAAALVMLITSAAGAAWTAQGPGPDTVAGPGYTQVTGAVEVIAPHPTNPNRVYVGTTNGGIWRTDNIGAVSPTWVPLTDDQPSLSITALCFDPLDPTGDTLYAGFGYSTRGLTHTGSASGPMPDLLLKTTNGGATWSHLRSEFFASSRIQKIVATPLIEKGQVLLVGKSYGGIYRSGDGGQKWKKVYENSSTDLVEDPVTPTTFFAATFAGVIRSIDGGLSWMSLPGSPAGSLVHLAFSPTADELGRHWLYAGVSLGNVSYSTDGGNTWTAMDPFPDGSHPLGTPDGTTQMAVSPTNPRLIFSAGDGASWFRGNAAGAPGSQWFALSGGNTGFTSPHTDSRSWAFSADPNILLESDDGGIYRLRNASSGSPVWESAIGTLSVTEFLSIAYDRVHDTIFGACWDNGIPSQTVPNSLAWGVNEDFWGDGQQVGVDNGTPGQSVHYSSQQNLFHAQRRVVGPTTTSTPLGLDIQVGPGTYLHYNFLEGNIYPDNPNDLGTVRFDQTFIVNAIDGSRVVIGTNYLYESFDRGDHFVSLGGIGPNVNNDPIPLNPVGTVSAYAYGHALDVNELVIGTYGNVGPYLWLRRNGTGYPNPVSSYPGSYPRDIAIDPDDPDRIFVLAGSGSIWRTIDGGATASGWTDLTAARGFPTTDPHTLALIPTAGGSLQIAVGGLGGVFVASEDDDRAWHRLSDAGAAQFPNAIVADLIYDTQADVLVAGTYGRGAWKLTGASTEVTAGPCAAMPRVGCQSALSTKSSLSLSLGTKPSVVWKWTGASAALENYGTPPWGTTYELCIYDASGGGPLRMSAFVPSGIAWKSTSKVYSYKSKTAEPEGITAVKLGSGTPGKLQIKGAGAALQTPAGLLVPPVTVQLQPSTGSFCAEAVFSAPTVNDGQKFKAKSD